MNPTKEWDKEEGEGEEDAVVKAGSHLPVVKVGKTIGGVAMKKDCLPSCVLDHSQQRVKHVVKHLLMMMNLGRMFCLTHLCKSNTTLGVERARSPAKHVEGAMPEAIIAKSDNKVDAESEQKVEVHILRQNLLKTQSKLSSVLAAWML